MTDTTEVEKQLERFYSSHSYNKDRLDAISTRSFIEKWKLMLAWQDDHIVMTGTPQDVEQHINSFSGFVADWIPSTQYPRVLDLGCGAGEAEALRQLGYTATGVTLGTLNIDYAKEAYNIELTFGDMHNLNFQNETFDAVITKHSFEHCFTPILVTTEIWHVLKTGGRWILIQPNTNEDVGFNWGHPSILSARQRESLFTHFGFKILHNTETETVCEKLSEDEIASTSNSPCLGYYSLRRELK